MLSNVNTSYEIGQMFWGKSLSYPWWPCVIVPNNKNEIDRNRKKFGKQYHVQFIGSDYDICWITYNFLIIYQGKEHFESFVEEQLTSNLSPQEKVKFDMRMSGNIQVMWVQACNDAEHIYPMNAADRLAQLPQSPNMADTAHAGSTIVLKTNPKRATSKGSFIESLTDPSIENKEITVKKPKPKKISLKRSISKVSDKEDESDYETKEVVKKIKKKKAAKRPYTDLSDNDEDQDIDEGSLVDPILQNDIEERCFSAYLAQETYHRLSNDYDVMDQSMLENTLKEQWAALDIDTKLLYLNDEVCYLGASKSKVSGRKIKIPSRLRRTEDIAKIKKSSLKRHLNEPPAKKLCKKPEVTQMVLCVKTEDVEVPKVCTPLPSPVRVPFNSVYRETINDSLWTSLIVENCSSEMMRVVMMKCISDIIVTCCHCFKPLLSTDKTLTCKGDCQSSYHLYCALQNKIIRSDDSSLCVHCNHKQDLCCVCKNSKYMKKQFLVKCQKPRCPLHFHVTCVKFLTFMATNSDSNDLVLCSKHSCLTCSREDIKHPCNDLGILVSCIKCPISYHNNLICIPAGSRIVGRNKLICYRHFDNNFMLKKSQQLSRCFVCFNDNATLKCCRCRAVFHPKCMSMATYTDLLRDYVCTTCKLEQPMFEGQVVWFETNKKWIPCEIVSSTNSLMDNNSQDKNCTKTLTVQDLDSQENYLSNRCELIPFLIGLSVLADFVNVNDPVVHLAKLRNILYWNWRSRMRPMTSVKYPIIGQSELLKHSFYDYPVISDSTTEHYEVVSDNIVPEEVQRLIEDLSLSQCCSCTSLNSTCPNNDSNNFTNYIEYNDRNCTNEHCHNRKFIRQEIELKAIIISDSLVGRGVKIENSVAESQLLGECTGSLILGRDVLKKMYKRQHLDSVSYIVHLFGDIFLDCETVGNEWRYVNHSCQPNAELVCKNVSGSLKLGIISRKPIFNEEITVDYRQHNVLKYGFVCQCHSVNCSQIIGPTSIFANDTAFIVPRCCIDNALVNSPTNVDMSPILSLPRLDGSTPVKIAPVEPHDNLIIDRSIAGKTYCYKCGAHGELITCDRGNCRKQYHMLCIETGTRPIGVWMCPVHFCIHCGESATTFCGNCPISCCKKHGKLHVGHVCTMTSSEQTDEILLGVENIKFEELEGNGVNISAEKMETVWNEEKEKGNSVKEESLVEDISIEMEKDEVVEETSATCDTFIENAQVWEGELAEKMDKEGGCVEVKGAGICEGIEEEIMEKETLMKNTQVDELDKEGGCLEVKGTVICEGILEKETSAIDEIVIENEQVCEVKLMEETRINNETYEKIQEPIAESAKIVDEVLNKISKDDLYGVCDLVPITFYNSKMADDDICHSEEIITANNTISWNNDGDEDKVSSMDHDGSEKADSDFDDERFEIIPCKIDTSEDVIVSPCIVDE